MIENISEKVLKMERKLPKPHNSSNSSIVVPKTPSPQHIRVVSTYGSDSDLLNIVTRFEPELTSSPSLSFYSSNPDLSNCTGATKTPTSKRLFQFVKKTVSSLRNKLVKNKHLALNKNKHKTLTCNRKNCQCCR